MSRAFCSFQTPRSSPLLLCGPPWLPALCRTPQLLRQQPTSQHRTHHRDRLSVGRPRGRKPFQFRYTPAAPPQHHRPLREAPAREAQEESRRQQTVARTEGPAGSRARLRGGTAAPEERLAVRRRAGPSSTALREGQQPLARGIVGRRGSRAGGRAAGRACAARRAPEAQRLP